MNGISFYDFLVCLGIAVVALVYAYARMAYAAISFIARLILCLLYYAAWAILFPFVCIGAATKAVKAAFDAYVEEAAVYLVELAF